MGAPTKITFRFEKDDDYRLIPVNGVWGGPTPRGDIMVNLFHESHVVPKEVTQTLRADGRLGQERERTPPPGTVQRTVLVGMILTAEQAESIGRWLQEKARQVRRETKMKGLDDSERNSPTTH